MFEFEDDIFKSILKVFGQSEKSFEKDVATIREWMKTQPHFPEIMENEKIHNFLLSTKCSIERTKEKIDNYYTLRTLLPEFFLDVDGPEMTKFMEIGYWVMLPKLTTDMCRVSIRKLRKPELINQLQPQTFIAHAVLIQEIRLKEDYLFKDLLIIDLENFNWEYFRKLTPLFLKKMFMLYEKFFSNRLKQVYIINKFGPLDTIMAMIKKVAKPKIFQRIHICEGSDFLHEILPIELIPKDYGGKGKSVEELSEVQKIKLLEYKNYLNGLNKLKVNEDLRPEKLNNDEYLGFYGNFKKLDVD